MARLDQMRTNMLSQSGIIATRLLLGSEISLTTPSVSLQRFVMEFREVSCFQFYNMQGSVLNSFSLAIEEDCSDGQKNDDRILQCCLSLNASPAPTIENGIKTVHRDTVLITDDRNLRLKAHTADCAVNSIKEFMKWVRSIKKSS